MLQTTDSLQRASKSKVTRNETSEIITELIIWQLEQHDLLTKCFAFSGDKCNTNFGGIERLRLEPTFFSIS